MAEGELPKTETVPPTIDAEHSDASARPSEMALGGGAGNDLRPATLALLLLLFALGVTATVTGWESNGPQNTVTSSDVNLSPPPWWPTPSENQSLFETVEARRVQARALDPKDKRLAALVKAYSAYNLADVAASGSPQSKALKDAYADYSVRARELFHFAGKETFVAVGAKLLDDFWRAMATKNVKALRAVSGTFVNEAQTIGLLRGEFLPAKHAKPLIASAFMLRWVSVLAQERPLDGLVTPVERLLLLRFKVGAHRVLKPKRRMELAKLLRRLQPDFPADELLASRFAAERQWSLCARFYRRALKGRETDARIRANVRFCDAQAESLKGGGP